MMTRQYKRQTLVLIIFLLLLGFGLYLLQYKEAEKYEVGCLDNAKAYIQVKNTISQVKNACGDVCQTLPEEELEVDGHGKFYLKYNKKIDCVNLWTNPFLDVKGNFCKAPRWPPTWWIQEYTYGGRLDLHSWYENEVTMAPDFMESLEKMWTIGYLNNMIQEMEKGTFTDAYGMGPVRDIQEAIDKAMPIKGLHILVIGSIVPWVEAILLSYGVGYITTVDYTRVNTNHPKIEFKLTSELSDQWKNGQNVLYDGMVTFSSLEHSGLARYGDSPNPWGDLITMARAWCNLKPGGRALVGLPTGKDALYFNAHRIYGKVLYSHLFTNWNEIYRSFDNEEEVFKDTAIFHQHIHVIEKPIVST